MSSNAEVVALAPTFVTVRGRAGPSGIEHMGHLRLEPIQSTHHAAPLPTMRRHAFTLFEMMNEPVGHFMRNDIDKISQAILCQQHRIEAQSLTPKMCLPRAFPAQIEPYFRQRQRRVNLPGKLPGSLDPLMDAGMQRRLVESRQLSSAWSGKRRLGKRWCGHEMLECLVAPLTDKLNSLFSGKLHARDTSPPTIAR